MRRLVSLALACALAATATATATPAGDGRDPSRRIRPTQAVGERLIADGIARSPTFRGLISRLERSDVIVYITVRVDMRPNLGGSLRIMGRSATDRFVHISLNGQHARHMLVALLGHELQHAVEVADAPDVASDEALSGLYRRIGLHVSGDAWDSRAARETGQIVRDEYHGGAPETRLARHDRADDVLLSGGSIATAR
jgi:hypothetical protein